MSYHMNLSSRLHVPPSCARRARTLSVESLESRTLLNGGALLARLRSGHALIAEVAHMHGSGKAKPPTPKAPTPTPQAPTTTPQSPTTTSSPVVNWGKGLSLQQTQSLWASLIPLQRLGLLVLPNLPASVQTQFVSSSPSQQKLELQSLGILTLVAPQLVSNVQSTTPPSTTTPPALSSPVASWLAYENLNQPNSPVATWLAGMNHDPFIRLIGSLTLQQKQDLAKVESLPPNDQQPYLVALMARSSQLESLETSGLTPNGLDSSLVPGFTPVSDVLRLSELANQILLPDQQANMLWNTPGPYGTNLLSIFAPDLQSFSPTATLDPSQFGPK